MAEPIRLRVYDARYESAFTARILDMLKDEPRVTAQQEPMDFSEGGRTALIAFTPPDDEDIARYDWIHVAGAGIDKIAGVLPDDGPPPVMTRTVGAMGLQMAEYALSYVLADFQRHTERRAAEDDRAWSQGNEAQRYLFESEVAIIGTGAIGRHIAAAFRPLAERVVGFSRSGSSTEGFDKVHPLTELEQLKSANVVILALPATASTEGLIDADVLAQPSGTLLLNIGRGEPLDLDALRRALDNGSVRRAVLDVFPVEPLPDDHWTWSDPRVTVTSHLSGITRPQDTVAAFLLHLNEAGDGLPASTVDPRRGY